MITDMEQLSERNRLLEEKIKEKIKTTDFAARLCDDRFVVILQSYGNIIRALKDKADEINMRLVDETYKMSGVSLSVGASYSDIGYTTELYGCAEKALRQTKQNGGNGCMIFEEEAE